MASAASSSLSCRFSCLSFSIIARCAAKTRVDSSSFDRLMLPLEGRDELDRAIVERAWRCRSESSWERIEEAIWIFRRAVSVGIHKRIQGIKFGIVACMVVMRWTPIRSPGMTHAHVSGPRTRVGFFRGSFAHTHHAVSRSPLQLSSAICENL